MINQLTYKTSDKSCEKLDFTTRITVPDDALSIRDILKRFQNGIPVESQQVYFETDDSYDEDDVIDPTQDPSYDMVDAFEHAEALAEKVKRKRISKKSETSEKEPKGDPIDGDERSEAEQDGGEEEPKGD